MKGADEVLSMPRIDSRLAADAEIDLGEQRRWDLDETHAPAQRRGAKSSKIADHAPAKRNDDVRRLMRASISASATRALGIGLGPSPATDDRRGAQAGSTQAGGEATEMSGATLRRHPAHVTLGESWRFQRRPRRGRLARSGSSRRARRAELPPGASPAAARLRILAQHQIQPPEDGVDHRIWAWLSDSMVKSASA